MDSQPTLLTTIFIFIFFEKVTTTSLTTISYPGYVSSMFKAQATIWRNVIMNRPIGVAYNERHTKMELHMGMVYGEIIGHPGLSFHRTLTSKLSIEEEFNFDMICGLDTLH